MTGGSIPAFTPPVLESCTRLNPLLGLDLGEEVSWMMESSRSRCAPQRGRERAVEHDVEPPVAT